MSRYTKSERLKYLEKYSKHEGSQKSFCEAEGINLGTFQYWLKASREEEPKSEFVEVVASAVTEREFIEITTRRGTTIRVPL